MTQPPADPQPPTRGERAFLRRLETRLTLPPALHAVLPFGDDMAPATPAGDLITTDMLMDGVDFESANHPWEAIGYKALAVNLSDCAAMAATPISAVVAVALDERAGPDAADRLLAGILECATTYDCPLVGGDTNSWPQPTVISVAVVARPATEAGAITRRGAQPGDRLYVTGPLGGSLLARHLRPQPRLTLAREIATRLPLHALIDISDGLAIDADRIGEASNVGIEIVQPHLATLVHPDAAVRARQTGRPATHHALHDGEDFELLLALDRDADRDAIATLGLLPIGRVVAARGLWLVDAAGDRTPLEPRGWEHQA
jgi:thiamine-monophosphate kinase